MHWMFMPLRRYAEFSGRSRRMEYWMYTLGVCIVWFVLVAVLFSMTGIMFLNAADPNAAGPAGLFSVLMGVGIFGIVCLVFWLALLIPSLAVTVRRLHDTNRSGWWVLAFYAPFILQMILGRSSPSLGMILGLIQLVLLVVLIVFMFLDGTRGPNRFGEDPKGATNAEVFG